MKAENPYYILMRYYSGFCTGTNTYKITLCKTDAARERLCAQATAPLPGWAAVHMRKTAGEMRDDIKAMFRNAIIKDETGMVL